MTTAWHSISVQDAFRELQSSPSKGLSEADARARIEKYGFNALKEAPPKPIWKYVLSQFESPLVILLIVAAGIAGALGEEIDAIAIVAMVILNAALGVFQEYRADRAIAALKKLLAPTAKTLREGKVTRIDAKALVPGDVVLLEAGDSAPADCKLFEAFSLATSEASLTGESTPVEKNAQALLAEKTPVYSRTNMLFAGTSVSRGTGRALVVETGEKTEFGSIAREVREAESESTPLQKRLESFGKAITILIVVLSGIVFIADAFRGLDLVKNFLGAVALAVAAIPEGLPAIVTITLAIGVRRMARRKALVRRLPAVEALGSATVICSDKTGTLTHNEMTVIEARLGDRSYTATGSGFSLDGIIQREGKPIDARQDDSLDLAAQVCVLCSETSLSFVDGRAEVTGDPTEAALLVLAEKAGVRVEIAREEWRKVWSGPFESGRKRMSVLVERGRERFVMVKGAPEAVIEKSVSQLKDGKVSLLKPGERAALLKTAEDFAAKGLRVLALAYKKAEGSEKDWTIEKAERDLTLIGLVGMLDPARTEVRAAMRLCSQAGIRVVMITGDHPLTAAAVSHEIGLPVDGVVTGPELEDASEAQLDEILKHSNVFARVSPHHKLRIVQALQRAGHNVAVTGDGVNDAPALKKSQIGVAMGVTGTDVAKEASDVVLTDDNFASIVSAVEEGRTVFNNIVKSARYLLSCNSGEVAAVFVAAVAGLPALYTAAQLLWMNLVTDGPPALGLGVDPAEPGVMKRNPRNPKAEVIDRRGWIYIIVVGMYIAAVTLAVYAGALYSGVDEVKARTLAFSTMIFLELFQALSSRSLDAPLWKVSRNYWLLGAFLLSAVLQIAAVQIGLLEAVFDTSPLSLSEWLLVIGASGSLLVISEVVKAIRSGSGQRPVRVPA